MSRERRDDRAADPQGLPRRGRGLLRTAVLWPPRGLAGALLDRPARRRLGAPEHPLPDRLSGRHQRPGLHPDDPGEPLRPLLRDQPDRQRAARHARPDLLAPVRGRLPPRLARQRRPGQHLPPQARGRRPQAVRPPHHREPVHAVGQADRDRRRGLGRHRGGPRPLDARPRRHDLRGREGRGRHAVLRHPRVPPAARRALGRGAGTRCGSASSSGRASASAPGRTTCASPSCSRTTTRCCSRPAAWRRSSCRCAASATTSADPVRQHPERRVRPRLPDGAAPRRRPRPSAGGSRWSAPGSPRSTARASRCGSAPRTSRSTSGRPRSTSRSPRRRSSRPSARAPRSWACARRSGWSPTTSGRLTGVQFAQNRLGGWRAGGRRQAIPIEGSEFVEPCDTLLVAIGQKTVNDYLDLPVELDRWGNVKVDEPRHDLGRGAVRGRRLRDRRLDRGRGGRPRAQDRARDRHLADGPRAAQARGQDRDRRGAAARPRLGLHPAAAHPDGADASRASTRSPSRPRRATTRTSRSRRPSAATSATTSTRSTPTTASTAAPASRSRRATASSWSAASTSRTTAPTASSRRPPSGTRSARSGSTTTSASAAAPATWFARPSASRSPRTRSSIRTSEPDRAMIRLVRPSVGTPTPTLPHREGGGGIASRGRSRCSPSPLAGEGRGGGNGVGRWRPSTT